MRAAALAGTQQDPVFTVLVVVGTDHHRFDRLVDWLDEWAERQEQETRVVFQHGSARSPRFGEGHVLLPHDALLDLMQQATVVVTHGGPATICEAWRHGRLQRVVPRDPDCGENVDGHQVQFARRLAGQGLVVLCQEREQLGAALDAARRDPMHVRLGSDDRGRLVARSVARFGEVVDELLSEHASVRAGRARWSPLRAGRAAVSTSWARRGRPGGR